MDNNMLKFDELFKIIGKTLWAIGMPYENPKVCLRFYVLLLCLKVMVVSEIAYINSIVGNPESFLDAAALAVCVFCGALSWIKIFVLYLNRTKLFALIARLKNLYKNSSLNPTQKNEILFVHKLINYYFILNNILIGMYNFSSLIIIPMIYFQTNEVVFVLPYAVLTPFAINSWPRWTIVYIFSISCAFMCILFITTVDSLFYLLTTLVCINFSSLSQEIEGLNNELENKDELPGLIKKHQEMLQLASDLNGVFTGPNFYNTLIGSIEICLIGFNLTTATNHDLPRFVAFLMQVLIQNLMMCVFGEKLIQESIKVKEAAYHCQWYDMDEKSKKTLLVLMFRSTSPVQLTGYKYSIIFHQTFTRIISSSWSYFTILRQVYTPNV